MIGDGMVILRVGLVMEVVLVDKDLEDTEEVLMEPEVVVSRGRQTTRMEPLPPRESHSK